MLFHTLRQQSELTLSGASFKVGSRGMQSASGLTTVKFALLQITLVLTVQLNYHPINGKSLFKYYILLLLYTGKPPNWNRLCSQRVPISRVVPIKSGNVDTHLVHGNPVPYSSY